MPDQRTLYWRNKVREALAGVSGETQPDENVVEELAQHADAEFLRARAEGLDDAAALARVDRLLNEWRADRAILRRPTAPRALIEDPAGGGSWLSGLGSDARYALRLIARQPRFALIAILTMALGIGTTTLLFTVTYGVLVQPLPWPNADRLVVLKETRGATAPRFGSMTNVAYESWRSRAATIDGLAAWSQRTATLTGAGEPERIRIVSASASLFDVLGVQPLAGAFYGRAQETTPVVVLSESLWRQRFGGDPAIVGGLVQLDGTAHTVVGILADLKAFPDRQVRAWVPFNVPPPSGNSLSLFEAVGLLRSGVTAAQAAAEGTARGRFVPDTALTTTAIFGNNGPVEISASPFAASLTRDVRLPLIVLLAAVTLLLLTAAANIASLQLARATARQREIAIRTALGAARSRVARQLIVESLTVSVVGGACGLALATLLVGLTPAVLPADFPRVDDVRVGGVVVAFALVLSVLTGIASGIVPALRLRRLDIAQALTEDGTAPIGVGVRSFTAVARMAIMAGQVAIACVLLVGAGLLGRSFLTLMARDRGFDPSGVMTARVAFPPSAFKPDQRHAVLTRILDRLSATPGVTHASFTSELPLTPGGSTSAFVIRTASDGPISVQASPRIVSDRYFAAAGMRVAEGRPFTDSDNESGAPVVVVNRAFARRFLKDAAVGTRVPMAAGYEQPSREATIVGVVDDVRYLTAADASQPEIYYSYRQFAGKLPVSTVTLIVRSADDPRPLARPLRDAVREADSRLAAESVLTMEERVFRGLARPRLYAIVLGGFAVSALAVALVGLFGVLSYTVAQRSRELAVRTALGARRVDVVRLVLGQMMLIAGAGVALGIAASFLMTRSMAALLHGVDARDLPTFVVVPLILLGVAAAACLPTAMRAAKVDAMSVLRR